MNALTRTTTSAFLLVMTSAIGSGQGAEMPRLDASRLSIELVASASGGTIRFAAKTSDDTAIRDAVRAAGATMTERLSAGDVAPLLAAFPVAPEIAERLKAGVAFVVSSDAASVTVQLVASSQESRTAIHDYLRALNGGTLTIERGATQRGNNLGWDAPRDPELKK